MCFSHMRKSEEFHPEFDRAIDHTGHIVSATAGMPQYEVEDGIDTFERRATQKLNQVKEK